MKTRKKPHPVQQRRQSQLSDWRCWPLVILAILAFCIALMRLHTYAEPFERDIASHAVIGHEIMQGRQLYADLWDSKPPAIFATYALADLLFGYGPSQVYFVGLIAAVITLLGFYRAGSACAGKAGGLWAAAFWTFICSDLWLWANQPNIEVGINACLIWAFALILTARETRLCLWRWLTIGALLALATLYKPVAVTFAAILAIFHILAPPQQGRTRKLAIIEICLTAAAGAIAWALVFAYFALTDRFTIFYQTIFEYAAYYARSRGGNPLANMITGFSKLFVRAMKSTPPLAVLTLAAIATSLWKGQRRLAILLAGFVIAAFLAVSLPGRFYPHYYQLWLCPLALGAGCFAGMMWNNNKPILKWCGFAATAIALVILLSLILPQYKLSPNYWSANKYGPQFVIERQVIAEVDQMLAPDETLFVWGQNPGFYFWTKRKPPTGVIWSTDMMDNPLAEKHTARALEDLKREKPEIFVLNRLQFKTPPDNPVIMWLTKNYIPLPVNPDRGLYLNKAYLFRIFVRRGGRIAASMTR